MDYCIGYFDRASHPDTSEGGAGVVIWINYSVCYCFGLNCVPKLTNTRSKVIAMWILLYCSRRLDSIYIKVNGDSKVVIDWINEKNRLQVVSLNSWFEKIKELVLTFLKISFLHIYREHDMVVDSLSKKSLRTS